MAGALGLQCVKDGVGRQCLQHAESEQRGTEGQEEHGVRGTEGSLSTAHRRATCSGICGK